MKAKRLKKNHANVIQIDAAISFGAHPTLIIRSVCDPGSAKTIVLSSDEYARFFGV